MHLILFRWLGVTPKNKPKFEKRGLKIKKNCTKSGIIHDLGEL